MCQSFGNMGLSKAEAEINAHEQNNASSLTSEIKPFTTKAPTHIIEALDLLAGHFGMTRNALVLKLINQYLGQAFSEYSSGYNSVFNNPDVSDEQQIIGDVESLTEQADVSEQAKDYVRRLVVDHLMST
ncbi:hypothetical protein [Acinetobacter indicus]|uniref:hypothetical protein n=1 Tax=Acinetobacter indicus TaxID=756892 RepID=UPI000CEC32B3|nr:hypothetical protein [Acinetobacter indicus]